MLQALVKKYLNKLRIVLQSKYLYIFLILFTSIYVVYKNINLPLSKYNGSEAKIEGIINSLKFNGDKLQLELKSKEKILVNYYIKDEQELTNIKNNYQLGDKVFIYGTFVVPSKNTVFNLFNYQNYLKSQKIYWLYNATSITKINRNISFTYKIKNMIISRINKISSSNYLKAFILGDTSLINDNIKDSYQINGISHLFAISGMHITLFSTLLLFIIKKVSKNNIFNNMFIIVFLLIYAFLANFTPSIMRTVLFFILISINKLFRLNIKTINLLILTCIILLAFNPFYIHSIGFIFSFIITFYLILFNEIINKHNNYFIKLLMTSIISFLASLPIVINNFFSINLLSIILNLIFVPFVAYFIFPITLITFIFPVLSPILVIMINILENMSLFFSKINLLVITLCKINIYCFVGYYLVITLILFLFKKQKYYSILILVPILIIHYNIQLFNKYPIITVLDVGQGDSILIILPHNNGNILIDTGGILKYDNQLLKTNEYSIVKNKTIPYLKSLGITKLDYLILSHGDYDHAGEAQKLIDNFNINKVIFNSDQYNELELELIRILKENNIPYYQNIKKLNINNNKLSFLNHKTYDNENDNSNVIYTKISNYKFLFMGDASIDVENNLIKKYNLEDIDILKVGHHGSKTSSGREFIDYIKPKYSIISVGKNNRYGHPNNEVLKNLEKSRVYRTDLDGSIMIKIKNSKLEIETCPP